MDAPNQVLRNPNAAPILPAGVRVWNSDRYGGRLHVRAPYGTETVVLTRKDTAQMDMC